MTSEHCRKVVIGSGEGGKSLAWHLAQSGEPTMVIERKYVGGSCPNIKLSACQERDLEREGGEPRSARERIWLGDWRGFRGYGGCKEAEARDGRWADRSPQEQVQGDW